MRGFWDNNAHCSDRSMWRNTRTAQKLQKSTDLFDSAPYSGRSSSIKPSCSKTELNRCTTTEIRGNKNEDARTSLVVSTNRLPNSLKNWKASLLIGPWDSTAIGKNSPCDESPAYLTTLLDAAKSAAAPASHDEVLDTSRQWCKTPWHHERPAFAPQNPCQSIWVFSVETARARWFLRNRDAGWGKRSSYDDIKMVVALLFCMELAYIQDCAGQKSRLVFHSASDGEHKVS